MKTVERVVASITDRIDHTVTRTLFEMEYFGIDYRIKRFYRRVRSKAIFEIRNLRSRRRIVEGVMKKIEENNKNPH